MCHRLQFVLGTESGMVTSIVRKVQALIGASGRRDVTVEIVFPVSGDAITTSGQAMADGAAPTLPGGLAVVPGAAKGECSEIVTATPHDTGCKAHRSSLCLQFAVCACGNTVCRDSATQRVTIRSIWAETCPSCNRRRGLFSGGRLRVVPLHEDEQPGGAAGRV